MESRKLLVLAAAACLAVYAETPAKAVASADPRVKFKDGERLLQDLSSALELPRQTICRELSQYDCYKDAFRIVLGGVEPYVIRIVEPMETASLTSPIAIDRVALHVCTERVAEDVNTPSKAILFHPPPLSGADTKWKRETVARLYDRLLRRDPTAEETARMLGFYDTMVKESVSKDKPVSPARDWTVLGCFSLASSLESIFY